VSSDLRHEVAPCRTEPTDELGHHAHRQESNRYPDPEVQANRYALQMLARSHPRLNRFFPALLEMIADPGQETDIDDEPAS
jgi:hypothetical protein